MILHILGVQESQVPNPYHTAERGSTVHRGKEPEREQPATADAHAVPRWECATVSPAPIQNLLNPQRIKDLARAAKSGPLLGATPDSLNGRFRRALWCRDAFGIHRTSLLQFSQKAQSVA